MTGTTKQLKVSKTHETAIQKAGTAIYIANMSQTPTPCRTMPPPKIKTKANTSHSTRRPASETHQFYSHPPPTCCVHVHQQQSQTCRPGEPPALREVKHPHKGRTSVSRSPSTEQEVLSQFSGYSEEIGHFTRDPCKPHLKSCLQLTKHASKKQEVNTQTDWEHSYRMEHAEHFPAPMEMCMDDHHTQTTEKTQRQHLQDIGHAEFPPGMESTPVFPGNQSQQGNEEVMDTGTFTLGNTILNRYPALSTHTHQGIENSNKEAFPCSNYYADATPQMETSRQRPGADSTPSGKGTTVTSSQVTPMDPMDDIQPPTRKCISQTSVHFQDSLSSQFNRLLKSKVQGNRLAGHSHQYYTGFCCDEKRNDRDLHRNWNDREQLSNTELNTTSMAIQVIPATHKEVHLLSGPSELQPPDASEVYLLTRPLKTMAHRYRHTEKEVHLLSGPPELQPPDDSETQKFRSSTQIQQPRQEYSRFTETEKAKFQDPFIYNDERNFVWHNSVDKFSPNPVYMTTPNTSSVSNSVFF